MTITIYEAQDNIHVYLGSKDKRFAQNYGDFFRTSKNLLLTNMKEVATWCNNTLKEECLFEVE